MTYLNWNYVTKLAIYVNAQLVLDLSENIAVAMEHVEWIAHKIHAPMLNVNAILVGPGMYAKIVSRWLNM